MRWCLGNPHSRFQLECRPTIAGHRTDDPDATLVNVQPPPSIIEKYDPGRGDVCLADSQPLARLNIPTQAPITRHGAANGVPGLLRSTTTLKVHPQPFGFAGHRNHLRGNHSKVTGTSLLGPHPHARFRSPGDTVGGHRAENPCGGIVVVVGSRRKSLAWKNLRIKDPIQSVGKFHDPRTHRATQAGSNRIGRPGGFRARRRV